MLAKMATRKAKPNGQFYLRGDDVLEFMKEQSVQNIPGTQDFSCTFLCFFNLLSCIVLSTKVHVDFFFSFTYNSQDFDTIFKYLNTVHTEF